MLSAPLRGIVAAPLLPMRPDAEIDWETLGRYLAHVAEAGPTAIAVNMDASEGPSLTREEQLRVVAASREAVAGRCPVVSGLIATHTADAVVWARELAAAGAQGLAVFPPFPTFLGNPVPSEMVYRYHRAIADAVDLPLVAFQFPKAFGPDYSPETLRRLAGIPTLVGLKEASFDTPKTIETIEAVRDLPRRIGVLTGSDTFIFEALVMGCDGALIGFAGIETEALVAMHAAVERQDYASAKTIWDRLAPLARFCWRPPMRDYRPRMKELLRLTGMFPSAAVRPPQLGVDEAERAELRRLAQRAGLVRPESVPARGDRAQPPAERAEGGGGAVPPSPRILLA